MPLAMKVTRGQIEKALDATSGTVSRAAGILGIARKNLYIRMATLGIDPGSYRRNRRVASPVTPLVTVTGADRGSFGRGSGVLHGSAGVSESGTFTKRSAAPNLAAMQERGSTAAAESPTGASITKLRQPRSIYLRPEQWRELDGACFDLAAKRRERQSPSRLLEGFIDECFADWLRRVLTAKKVAQK